MYSYQRREDRFYEPPEGIRVDHLLNRIEKLESDNTILKSALVMISLPWLVMALYAIGMQSYLAAIPFAAIFVFGLFMTWLAE